MGVMQLTPSIALSASTKYLRLGRKVARSRRGKSCGPVSAARAAYWQGAAGLEVDWLWILFIAAITSAGPTE